MGLIDLPTPTAMYEGVKDAQLGRKEVDAFVSASYSAWISFMWRSGTAKWALWFGEGQAMQDSATAMYLTLCELQTKNFLTLTVPEDLLSSDNLSRFQTRQETK
jgi:hypothetical protein